jgi:uncharacterized membrane protein
LANGLGFVYNPGEPILGTTTPLYTLLLALLALLTHQPIPQISLVINTISLWIGAGLLFDLVRDEGFVGGIATALVFITHPLLPQTIGMESVFLVCLMLLSIRFFVQGRLTVTAVLVGLLILTRYEMVLLVGIFAAVEFLEHRRGPIWLWPVLSL